MSPFNGVQGDSLLRFYALFESIGGCLASRENRDLRQLLCHRHRLVQERTQLQAAALNEGVRERNVSATCEIFVVAHPSLRQDS
jgi:hypothetical protein